MDELRELRLLRAQAPRDTAEEVSLTVERLRAEFRRARPARSGRRVRRAAWTGALAGGLAASLAVGVAVLPGSPGPEGTVRPALRPMSATVLLERAAESAAREPAPRPDQYVYTEWKGRGQLLAVDRDGEVTIQFVDSHHRHWISVSGDRPSLLRLVSNRAVPMRGGTAPLRVEKPGDRILKPCGRRGAGFTGPYLGDLPTDPRKLLALMEKEAGEGDRGDRLWNLVTDILSAGKAAPPQVRAALFRAIALIPQTQVVQDAVDGSGRHGVAVARTSHGAREELVFDRRTYRYLGQRKVLVDPSKYLVPRSAAAPGSPQPAPEPVGLPAGTVLGAGAELQVRIVDDMPAPRPGAPRDGCTPS